MNYKEVKGLKDVIGDKGLNDVTFKRTKRRTTIYSRGDGAIGCNCGLKWYAFIKPIYRIGKLVATIIDIEHLNKNV